MEKQKKKIIVLGAMGMLGSAVVGQLNAEPDRYEVRAFNAYGCNVLDVNALRYINLQHSPDAVINCAGTPNVGDAVNSIGPRNISETFFCKIINVSTDCVLDPSLPLEDTHRVQHCYEIPPLHLLSPYAVSKLMGEIEAPHVVNIRTSFIGYEHGLLRWLLMRPPGSKIEGWANALWSGSTVGEVAKALVECVDIEGLHSIEYLAAPDPWSKYKLLGALIMKLGLDLELVPVETPHINRAMRPTIALPFIEDAIESMLPPPNALLASVRGNM